MGICAQLFTHETLIRESIQKTEWYKSNGDIYKHVRAWDAAPGWMVNIEQDLREQELLSDDGQPETRTPDREAETLQAGAPKESVDSRRRTASTSDREPQADHEVFVIEIAERAAEILRIPGNRVFLHSQVSEYFKKVDAWTARDKAGRDEWQKELGDKFEVVVEPLFVETTADVDGENGGHWWVARKRSEDLSSPAKRIWRPIADHPMAMFPPYSKWGTGETRRLLHEDEALLRDCVLVAVIHDRTWPTHQPVYFYRDGETSSVGTKAWVEVLYSELVNMPWASTQAEVDRAKAFVRQSFLHVEGVVAARPPAGPDGGRNSQRRKDTKQPYELSREALGQPGETGLVPKQGKATPETDRSLVYQAAAAEFYNIPKSMLSKAAKKMPGEPGYLWSDTDGRRKWYRKSDLDRLSRSRKKLRGS